MRASKTFADCKSAVGCRGVRASTESKSASAWPRLSAASLERPRFAGTRYALRRSKPVVGDSQLEGEVDVGRCVRTQGFEVVLRHRHDLVPGRGGAGEQSNLAVEPQHPVREGAHLPETVLGLDPFAVGDIHACREADDHGDHRRDPQPMPAHELAAAVSERVGPGGDRLVPQVPAHIVGEGGDGLIAFARVLLEGLGGDGIEIALAGARKPIAGRVPRVENASTVGIDGLKR